MDCSGGCAGGPTLQEVNKEVPAAVRSLCSAGLGSHCLPTNSPHHPARAFKQGDSP